MSILNLDFFSYVTLSDPKEDPLSLPSGGKLDLENRLHQTTFCEVVEWHKFVKWLLKYAGLCVVNVE